MVSPEGGLQGRTGLFAFCLCAAGFLAPVIVAVATGDATRLVDIRALLLLSILVVLSWIDLRTLTLPDWLTLPLTALGLCDAAFFVDRSVWDALLGALLSGGLLWAISEYYWRVRGVDALGLGDAKLAAAAGAWLGWLDVAVFLTVASVIGLLGILVLAVARRRLDANSPFPFGPALALSLWGVWVLGPFFTLAP